jgi:hypothetical protein
MGKLRQREQKPTTKDAPLFHTAEDLLEHEISTLLEMAKIPGWPPLLSSWKTNLISAYRNAENSRMLDIHLRFTARAPRARGSEPPHLVELGSKIKPGNPPLVTYFLAVGEQCADGRCRGLRKFHFDLDLDKNSKEPKPVFHIQSPGRMFSALVDVGYSDDAFDSLYPDLDKPRIPSLPTSVALLAHSALLEYVLVDNRIGTFIGSPQWLKPVAQSEEFVLHTFLEHSLRWSQKTVNRTKSLISYFYRYPPV